MRNYNGLFHSTYTEQLPFGADIVCGAYDEGYDWAYNIYIKGFNGNAQTYLDEWLTEKGGNRIIPRIEYEEYITTHDWDTPIPSKETDVLMQALYKGSPRPYDGDGHLDGLGVYDTNKLAGDIASALWDGAYDGYKDACYVAATKLGIELEEVDE